MIPKKEIERYCKASSIENIPIADVENMIKNDYNYILSLIYYNSNINKIDNREFSFAVNNLKSVLKIWIPRPDEEAPPYNETGVTFLVFVTAMQELIKLYHTKEEFYDDFVGFKYSKTYTSVIKKPETNAVMLGLIRKKLQNRYSYNLGSQKQMKIIRKIEKNIYQILDYIFSFQNYEDLTIINKVLYSDISGKLMCGESVQIISEKEHEMMEKIGF